MKAYRLDRRNEMSVGQTIDLLPIKIDAPEIYTSLMQRNYPGGLTSHGITHYLSSISGDSGSFVNAIVESICEHTRQLNYPDMTSRFQAIFAAETIDDAKKWRQTLNKEIEYPLYEIEFEASNAVILDPTWLTIGDTFTLFQGAVNAEQYWQGIVSETPALELVIKPPAKVIRKMPDDWFK